MTQLSDAFKSGSALIPYFTFGDPTDKVTEQLVKTSFDNGADVIELGFPFSDPIADGPVIQAAHNRALTQQPDINLNDLFAMIMRIKKTHNKPIVIMLSVNSVHAYGCERFFKQAKKSNKQVNKIVTALGPNSAQSMKKLQTRLQTPRTQ